MSYNIYRSLLASRFLTDPCFIRKITIFICQYWCSVFCCAKITCDWYPHRLSPSVIRLSSTRTYGFHFLRSCPAHHSNSRDDWGGGGGGLGWSGIGKILRSVAQNYIGAKFIAPVPDRNPTLSWYRAPAKDLVGGRREACVSTIIRLLSQFVR